jgi:hypothetical protein
MNAFPLNRILTSTLTLLCMLALLACQPAETIAPQYPGYDAGGTDSQQNNRPAPFCGDGTCTVGETAASCPGDCIFGCGDQICYTGEDSVNCPADCGAVCGDGVCTQGSENNATCPNDCGVICGDGICTQGIEDNTNCPNDCTSFCGDGLCTAGENSANCPNDCGVICGDGACTEGETSATCPGDCGSLCGDGVCLNGKETTANCPEDCGSWCNDGVCNGNENHATCPTDCPNTPSNDCSGCLQGFASCAEKCQNAGYQTGICIKPGSNQPNQCCGCSGGNGNNGNNNPDPEPVEVEPIVARYVRVTTQQTLSWVAWSEIQVLSKNGTNIALGSATSASSFYENSAPGLVVDGDEATSWNSGDFAPATITIDLGKKKNIYGVRLLVTQNPPGHTVHKLEWSDNGTLFTQVHTFSGYTENGDWLVYPSDNGSANNTNVPGVDPNLPKGLAWTRTNPMFISGLSVSVGAPQATHVNEYFNTFNANAVHTWGKGLPDAINGWGATNHPEFRWVAWVNNEGKSLSNQQIIGGVGANPPGRIGYQVGDEPGLNGDGMVELKEIQQGINNVLSKDPNALTIVNFSLWADDFLGLLDYYGSQTKGDVYSYDRYSVGYSEHETMATIRSMALKWNRPYWRYIRAYHDVPLTEGDQGAKTHESDMRWDALLGLVYGYTGHTWFVYQASAPHKVGSVMYKAQGGLEQGKTALWHSVAAINKEMRHLGRAITQLTSTDVRYRASQGFWNPKGIKAWTPGAGSDPYMTQLAAGSGALLTDSELAIGYFVDDSGEQYVMIQNQNHQNASWPINNLKSAQLVVSFDFANAPSNVATTHVQTLNKKTGVVENHMLVPMGGNKAQLKAPLIAGDAIFFKYDTGKSFALGP